MSQRMLFAIVLIGLLLTASAVAENPSAPDVSATEGPRPEPVETPAAEEIDAAVDRGVDFLLSVQGPGGWWGSARRTKGLNIYAPAPGAHQAFRAAVTSMCIEALIETAGDRPDAADAVDRAETWLFEHLPKVRRANATALYNNWAHAYSIQCLADLYAYRKGDAKKQKRIVESIEQQIDLLGRYECVGGGWGYYDFHHGTARPGGGATSFTTATVLLALADARNLGVEVPEEMVRRGMASIRRQRKPDFSHLYSQNLWLRPMSGINRPAGSLGRTQACNAAMHAWGDELVADEVLAAWLDRLFARNGWLGIGRKRPIPHESWFAVAGYFFYYGHYYAARCIELLPEEDRGFYQDHLAALLLRLQEKDGSWWDYPLYDYHQPYGTAFALMSLERCRRGDVDE